MSDHHLLSLTIYVAAAAYWRFKEQKIWRKERENSLMHFAYISKHLENMPKLNKNI